MITLKTLPQATAQEVYDQVKEHLLQQGQRAVNDLGECQYRAGDLKCAAGCLIADDEYDPDFEGRSWANMVITGKAPNSHVALIVNLQLVHDHSPVEEWSQQLARVALRYNLNP